jgi:hypothetical protein
MGNELQQKFQMTVGKALLLVLLAVVVVGGVTVGCVLLSRHFNRTEESTSSKIVERRAPNGNDAAKAVVDLPKKNEVGNFQNAPQAAIQIKPHPVQPAVIEEVIYDFDPRVAGRQLEAVLAEEEKVPFEGFFTIVARLREDELGGVYEAAFVNSGKRFMLNTSSKRFTSTGKTLMVIQYEKTLELEGTDGFSRATPIYREARTESGAAAITSQDAKLLLAEAQKKTRSAREVAVAAMFVANYKIDARNDFLSRTKDLAKFLGIEADVTDLGPMYYQLSTISKAYNEAFKKGTVAMYAESTKNADLAKAVNALIQK